MDALKIKESKTKRVSAKESLSRKIKTQKEDKTGEAVDHLGKVDEAFENKVVGRSFKE